MSDERPGDSNPYQIEADLTAYAPRPPRIDRDRLMFEAGRAAAQEQRGLRAGSPFRGGVMGAVPVPVAAPTGWLWPASTLAMSVLAASLTVALVLSRTEPMQRVQLVERVSRAPSPALQSTTEPAPRQTIAVSSGGLRDRPEELSGAEPTVVTLESLPEEHVLRVRQAVLTKGVDELTPAVHRPRTRLAPLPTRGTLMRKMSSPPAAIQKSSAPLFQWPLWSESPANM